MNGSEIRPPLRQFGPWQDVDPSTAGWAWPHFTPYELRCRGTGRVVVDPGFMDRVEVLRGRVGRPIVVTSYWRDPDHNERVSSTGRDGPHTTARAIDIAVHGLAAHDVVRVALELGFSGLGVRQHGPIDGRFLHLDDLPSAPGRPRPWIWSYA